MNSSTRPTSPTRTKRSSTPQEPTCSRHASTPTSRQGDTKGDGTLSATRTDRPNTVNPRGPRRRDTACFCKKHKANVQAKLEGGKQTTPRAEARAVLEAIKKAATPTLIIADCLNVVQRTQEIIKKNNTINSTVEIKNSVRKKLKKLLIDYFGNLYMLNYNILKWFIAKLSRDSNRQILPNRSLVLIDTFVIPGYTNTKRWYGSLWENLNDELKNETYFVSTIIRTSLSKLFPFITK